MSSMIGRFTPGKSEKEYFFALPPMADISKKHQRKAEANARALLYSLLFADTNLRASLAYLPVKKRGSLSSDQCIFCYAYKHKTRKASNLRYWLS